LKEVVFADIGRKFFLAVLPEENHENLSALKEGCVHSYLEKVNIRNSLRKIAESQELRERPCSPPSGESYILILQEENHENLRALQGFCVHWHLKKIPIANSF
jgi:hypothetical protein